MIVNVPLNAIGEDLASLPGLNIPSLVYCVREGAEIKFCAFCTRQIVVSPTSPPFSASLSRAPAIRPSLSLALSPPLPVLTAMKRGRDNARVEEISPRFYPRHRFEGSTATVVSPNLPRSRILVISDGGTNFPSPSLFSFFFPRFFSPRRVDKNFAKPFRARIERCEYALDKFAELYISAATFEFSRVIPHRRMVN